MDWAIELSNTSKVILIHRRDDFRGAQASIDKVHQLVKENKIEIYTKYQISSLNGSGKLESICIKHDNGTEKKN